MADPKSEKEGSEGKQITSDDTKTICECRRFGAIGVVKELTEKYKLAGKGCSSMIRIVKYAGIGISILCGLVYIIACITSKHIWDMFHVLRLHIFLCWGLGIGMHILTDFHFIRDDPHSNMYVGLLMVYFYTAAVTWVACEAHATFKAFTAGIISARNKVYYPFGYGTPLIPLGILMAIFHDNLGTEPRCFIAWDMSTKVVFFLYLSFVTICGVAFSIIIKFNMSKPQTKRKNVIPDLHSQAKGTIAASIFMFLFWCFGAYNYVRPQQSEWPDYYCFFSLALGWFGVILFLFYGFMSRRFRNGLSGKYAKYQKELRHAMSGKQSTEDATSELGTSSMSNDSSPVMSRPATAKSSLHEEPIEEDVNVAKDDQEIGIDSEGKKDSPSSNEESDESDKENDENNE